MDTTAGEDNNIIGIEGEDVVGLDYIHIEVKRVQALNLDDAMEQAKKDSKGNQLPTVFHRKNNKKWKVTMELEDWIQLYSEFYSSMKLKERYEYEDTKDSYQKQS